MDLDPTIFGLLATAILIATLTGQTIKQWREHATRGIARWFFLGQVSASVCFIVYSVLIGSTLFAVANTLILASALAGYVVLRINRSRALRDCAARPSRGKIREEQAEVEPGDGRTRVAVL